MKRKLLYTALAVSLTTIVSGQQWVNFPSGSTTEWVNLNDLDVSGSSITVEALVSIHDLSSGQHDIIDKHSGTLDCNYLLRPDLFGISTSDGFFTVDNTVTLCQDTVYHLAAKYDGSFVKYYVNGIEVSSQTATGTLVTNNLPAAIGNRSAQLDEQFTGYEDEVRIWNVARTASQLAANFYDLPNPTTQPGLLAYYKLNGNYTNIQGNTAWNGTPTGSMLSLAANPYYYGALHSFCSPVAGVFENSLSSAMEIFPNPSTTEVTLNFGKTLRCNVQLTNTLGEMLEQTQINSSSLTLDLSKKERGIYFVAVTDEQGNRVVRKVVKM